MPRLRAEAERCFFSLRDGEWMVETSDFPDPRTAGAQGLLCIGGDLKVETLRRAYGLGVFPWPQEGYPMMWFCPDPRGVLRFDQLHWPRRFLREQKKSNFQVTCDLAFREVILACAKSPRKPHLEEPGDAASTGDANDLSEDESTDDELTENWSDNAANEKIGEDHEGPVDRAANGVSMTWILPEMIDAYISLHEAGDAHSFECWHEGKLVGGLYGVWIKGVFSGESMFHSMSGASKHCLHALVTHLQSLGVQWMDTQMVTPILKSFGGTYISREEYLSWVASSQERGLIWR